MTLRLYGSNELGIYSASARIALLISLIVFSFQTAWGPFALSIYKKKDSSITIVMYFLCTRL